MKKVITFFLLICYSIPFVFLAMNEDVLTGTPNFYFVMIIFFGILCFGSIKIKKIWIVATGNILSFTSSCLFAWVFQTEKWEWYFKPFLPNQLIIFETVIVFIIQIITAFYFIKKTKHRESEGV